MGGDLHVDMEELAREIRLVDKNFAAALRRNMRKAVAESGAAITGAVKARAAWSTGATSTARNPHTSIPSATSLTTSFGVKKVGVQVKVNARKAPHARPLEQGNGGGSSVLRHPVFHKAGEKGPWAEMPTRPFFFVAARAMTPVVEAKIQTAIDTVAFEAGFKGR